MDEHCLELWKKIVQLKAKNICQRPFCPFCFNQPGTKYLQAHHVEPRTCWSLRHDTKNGILLCRKSHGFWAENKSPLIQRNVLEFYSRHVDMEYIESRKYSQTKLDYKLIELKLKQELDELENWTK